MKTVSNPYTLNKPFREAGALHHFLIFFPITEKSNLFLDKFQDWSMNLLQSPGEKNFQNQILL